jgi:hypothetical protein
MDQDSSRDPTRRPAATPRDNEHRWRNEQQVELLRNAYQRSRHAAYIEEALRRAGRRQEADDRNDTSGADLPTEGRR